MKSISSLALALSFLASSGLVAEEKLNLSLDWKPGKIYQQRIEMNQIVGVPRHGEANAKTTIQMGLKSAKGGLQASFNGLNVFVDPPAPAKNQAFDSTMPLEGNQDIAQFFGDLHRQSPKLILDDRGGVREIRGMDQLKSQNPIIDRFLGRDQMINLMQQGWLVSLPVGPVIKGDSWPYQMKFPTPVGALFIKGNYTLGGRVERGGRNLVEIQLNGQVQGDFNKPDPKEKDEEILKMQGMMMLMGVKVKIGIVKGTLWYDPAKKMLTGSDVDTNIRLSVDKYPENGQPTEIPIHQTMALTLTEN
jgi:hypothetical protein